VFVNRIIETIARIIARSRLFRATLFSTMAGEKIVNGGSMKQKMAVIVNAMIRGSIRFAADVNDTLIV
jgi:hypothetical protein